MMKTLIGAIALTLAVPAFAADSAPEPKQDCCEKMKEHAEASHAGRHGASDAGKECCCKDMDKKGHEERGEHGGQADHGGHAH